MADTNVNRVSMTEKQKVEVKIPAFRVVSVFDVSSTEGEPLTLAGMLLGLKFAGFIGMLGVPFLLAFIKRLNDKGIIHERHLHFEANIKKLEEAEEAGYPILSYGGFNACSKCKYADTDTQRHDDDDFALVICKNPNFLEHKKHLSEDN